MPQEAPTATSVITYRMAPSTVRLTSNIPSVVEFADSFLDRAGPGEPPPAPMGSIWVAREDELHNQKGSVSHLGSSTSASGNNFEVRGAKGAGDPDFRAAVRSLTRELWLREHASASWYLHASAVVDAHTVVAFVGDKRHGKTTLLLDAVLNHGWRLVTNDGLLLIQHAGRLHAAPVPTLAKIRADTATRSIDQIQWASRTDPFNIQQVERWLARPNSHGGSEALPLYLTFRALGEPFGVHDVTKRRLVIAEVGFTNAEVSVQEIYADRPYMLGRALRRHHKTLPLRYSALHGYRSPARNGKVLQRVANEARYLRFQHNGGVGRLLEWLRADPFKPV